MSLSKIRGLSPELEAVQARLDAAIKEIVPSWISDGHELPEQTINPGSNLVKHGLGRALSGWLFLRVRGNSTPSDSIVELSSDKVTLELVSTSADSFKVKLWVF